jgi:hypothetical protein
MFSTGSYLIVDPSYESQQISNLSIDSSLRLSAMIVFVAVVLALLLLTMRPSRHQASVSDAAMVIRSQSVPHK